MFVAAGLEESAEGCRWLLERWAEFRNLLDRKAGWSWPEMFRFIRLQGKHSIEAVYDPGAQFHLPCLGGVVPEIWPRFLESL